MSKTCKVCGQAVTKFVKCRNEYWDWCSNKCMSADPIIIAKKQQTNLQKFGGHPMHNNDAKQKQRATVLSKYGVDNVFKLDQFQNKARKTNIKKYGVSNPSLNSEVVQKIKNSAVSRYSDDEIKRLVLDRRAESLREKFGVSSNKHCHISEESLRLMKNLDWIKDQHFNQKKSCQQIANELGISATPILLFLSDNGVAVQRQTTSQPQMEIADFIRSNWCYPVLLNQKLISPFEVDIYLPDANLAIELNGIYWHSEDKGRGRDYHVNKTQLCEQQQIHLLHIYDIEWNDPIKRSIIKSKLLHLLKQSKRIPARKCQIKEISSSIASDFLLHNHLQGPCTSKIRVGLYYNDQLVSVATFGSSRFNKNYGTELLRFCNITNHTVVGGLSKILSYVNKCYKINSIISYADRRWSSNVSNNVYESTGFAKSHLAKPNYKYFTLSDKPVILKSRNQFQKHLLANKLDQFDSQLSEHENMSLNGYYRIWDCGNIVYTRSLNDTTR